MTQVTNTTKTAITASFIAQLDALAARHTVFQIEYDAVNKTLFELLADCLSLYRTYQAATDAQESIVKAIKEILIARKMTIGKHVTTLSLIENRRAQTYVRALSIAINAKVATTDFAGWVTKAGGVEEVISQKTFTLQTQQKKAVLAYKVSQVKQDLNLALSQPLAVIPESHLIDLANIPTYTMLLGKTQPDGTTLVLSVVPNTTDAMWTAALDKIAKAEMAYEQKIETELLQASNDASNEVSIDESIDLLGLAA
ncbi:MAG: hypothetical protein J0649_03225 [Methylococcales bacterium]|nr:hypothetical protein [Methylococcales bacterium]